MLKGPHVPTLSGLTLAKVERDLQVEPGNPPLLTVQVHLAFFSQLIY